MPWGPQTLILGNWVRKKDWVVRLTGFVGKMWFSYSNSHLRWCKRMDIQGSMGDLDELLIARDEEGMLNYLNDEDAPSPKGTCFVYPPLFCAAWTQFSGPCSSWKTIYCCREPGESIPDPTAFACWGVCGSRALHKHLQEYAAVGRDKR